jgi:GT2 family glycosyltransferase
MVMPKIYHYYGDQRRLWYAGARWRPFPPSIKTVAMNQLDGPQFERYFTVEYAPSCCLMMPRQAVEKVGLFDPYYYFYYDDWDLSARFRAAGYEILFVPPAHLWHKVSITTVNSDKPARYWLAMGQSSVRFFLRHKSLPVLLLHTAWFVLRETAKLKLNRISPYLQGVRDGLADQRKRNE